mgnify:CR=1 FL=1
MSFRIKKNFKNPSAASHEEWDQILDLADNNYLKCIGLPHY